MTIPVPIHFFEDSLKEFKDLLNELHMTYSGTENLDVELRGELKSALFWCSFSISFINYPFKIIGH